jgi:hypothetical protein
MALKMASFKEKPELTHSRQDLPSCNPVPFVSKDKKEAQRKREFREYLCETGAAESVVKMFLALR